MFPDVINFLDSLEYIRILQFLYENTKQLKEFSKRSESHTYDTGKENGANGHKMAVVANLSKREISLLWRNKIDRWLSQEDTIYATQ
jgi:hypothetical protein